MEKEKNKTVFSVLQIGLLAAMITVGVYLLWQNLLPMYFAALLTFTVTFFTYKKNRWGYFAAATWGLACYQMAKEGFAFEDVKRWVMIGSIAVIAISLVLHEVYCRRAKTTEE